MRGEQINFVWKKKKKKKEKKEKTRIKTASPFSFPSTRSRAFLSLNNRKVRYHNFDINTTKSYHDSHFTTRWQICSTVTNLFNKFDQKICRNGKNVSAHGDLFHVIAANNTGGYRINFSDDGLYSTFFHIHKVYFENRWGKQSKAYNFIRKNGE